MLPGVKVYGCGCRKATDLGKRQAARAAKQQERTNAAIVLQKYARRRLAVRKVCTSPVSWAVAMQGSPHLVALCTILCLAQPGSGLDFPMTTSCALKCTVSLSLLVQGRTNIQYGFLTNTFSCWKEHCGRPGVAASGPRQSCIKRPFWAQHLYE